MTNHATATTPAGRPGLRALLRHVLPVLAVEVALPYAVYLVLHVAAMSDVVALAWSALPPTLSVGWQAWRSRRLNGVGVIVLSSIAVGVAMALLTGSPQLAVARDAVPNVVMAVALGGSLLLGGRPLVFFVVRAFGETYQPGLRERMARSWSDNPRFRQVLRRATAVGAVVLLAEAAVRLFAAQVLPVDVALPVLQVQSFAVWAGLVVLLRRAVVRAVRSAPGSAAGGVGATQPSVSTSSRSRSRSAATVDASRSNSSFGTPSSHLSVNTTSAPAG
jgi:hypothetical protein